MYPVRDSRAKTKDEQMNRGVVCIVAGLVLTLPFLAAAEEPEDFVALNADEIAFLSAPGIEGVTFALIRGNPEEEGIYVMRARFEPGTLSKPHYHDQDRHITVVSGTWVFGTDASGTCEGAKPLHAGAFGFHPKGAVHFDGSCGDEPAVVEITGMGPVKNFWVAD